MYLVPPRFARLILCTCFALAPITITIHGQDQAAVRSQTPEAKPSPSSGKPQFTDKQIEEMISKLQERIGNAANQVFGRIQKEESDLRIRFSYLRKPDRLDPNSYGSKADIAKWRESLKEDKEKEDILERLYANVDQDLRNALTQQKINQAISEQIKNELLKSFPWSTVKKRNELMRQFIAEHDELLAFYDRNWGTWKPASGTGTVTFDDRKLAASYQNLKGKISATGLEIEDQYKAMAQ